MQRSICLDVCDYTETPLCNLYDSTTDISGQAINIVVHTERNGFKEIRFEIPSVCADGEKNYRLQYLVTDYKLRVITNFNDPDKREIDWFFISEPKITHNKFSKNYEIRASHISSLLNTKNLNLEFSDDEGNNTGTIEQIAETILEGTGWHLGNVAKFYEEEKFVGQGVKKEKIRSFTASAKTGAFKMMSDLCDLFDAKPIYHGAGEYEEDGVVKIGRTVDIIPMNPFSKNVQEGEIPQEVLDGCGVLEMYYDKNVSNITRTANSDNLVTVFSAYGSYGDENGMVSLQTCQHAEITFGTLQPGTYCFEYLDARYFFTTDIETTGLVWSSLDSASRSYVFDGTNLFKVTKDIPLEYTTITGNIEYVKNQLSFIMDFSYYEKIGLLTDDMLLEIAKLQWNLPKQYITVQENSLELSDTLQELSSTASAGNGFLMLNIAGSDIVDGYVKLHLNKTTTYPDGVIFRSDYDEAKRNYFAWNTASAIKSSGESIDGKGAVIYIVHEGVPTTWEKAYVKAYGNSTDDYYRDSLGNVYELHTKQHYDRKSYDVSYPTDTYFPNTGSENIIYIADDTNKMYVWFNNDYTEIKASGYNYGLNEFDHPDYITLWTTEDTWHSGDKVYMFSADSIAGLFGPREDQVASNRDSIETALKNGTTESHPMIFIKEGDTAPLASICSSSYGWYYRSYENVFDLGDLYFCYGKSGEVGWSQVYVSNESNDPETISPVSGYNYYYSLKKMLVYKVNNNNYVPLNKTTEEKAITSAFAAVIEGCYKQEILTKGVRERYNYNDSLTQLNGNYAFKNEYNNYYLFSTGTRIVNDPSLVYYDSASRMVWLDNDEEHIVNSSEYSFRYLDFPKPNELLGATYALIENKQTSSNIMVHDNTQYEFSLPSGAKVVCFDKFNTALIEYTNSPFVTPLHTTHVQVLSSTIPTSSHWLRVVNYNKVLFIKNVKYIILNSTGAGKRLGLNYLMDEFIRLSHDAYEVKLPVLQQAQKTITDSIKNLSKYLGDMYREGFWQETSYVEGDEEKLYSDALENFKEVSHPQYTYDVSFLDLYGSDDNLDAVIKTEYPNVDITYAVHLVDPEIETNQWAYIDSIDKCYDQPWKTQLEINTQLSTIGQQSFTDVLAKIAEVANQVKAKQTVYDRAGYINSAGKVAADKLEGLINTNKIYIMGGTSNWYTDDKGNITFESADGQSAMMLTGRGLMVSNSKDQYGDWLWRTAISGLGINADVIATGEFSATHIIAGTITTDKLASNVGQELEIGTNKALTLYATVDGSRPAGALTTIHPNESDSWIQIASKDGNTPAHINIQSGGEVHLYGGSSMDIETGGSLSLTGATLDISSQGKINIQSGSTLDIKSGGVFLVDSQNFKIKQNQQDSSKYDVTVIGNITTTGGNIAGYTIGQATSGSSVIDYMYAGQTVSVDTNSAGVYLGTNGFNLGGKFVYKLSDESLNIKATSILLGDVNSSYISLSNNSWSMNATASLTLSSGSSISITSGDTITLGNSSAPFTIGADKLGGSSENVYRSYIYRNITKITDTVHNGIYIGTDGIVLGKGKFTVTDAGYLTATSGKIAGWLISDTTLTGNTTGIAKTTNNKDVAFWAGSATASSANFQVTQGGKLTSKDIDIQGGSISIKDNSNNVIFSASNAGVAVNKGSITLKDSSNNTIFSASSDGVTVNKGSIVLKDSSNNVLFSASSSGAEIKGTLRATALYLGNNNILSNNKISLNADTFASIDTGTSGIQITPTSIAISSSGTLDINTSNFKINSTNKYLQSGNWKLDNYGLSYFDSSTQTYAALCQDAGNFRISCGISDPHAPGGVFNCYFWGGGGEYHSGINSECVILFNKEGMGGFVGSLYSPVKEVWGDYVCYWHIVNLSSRKLKHDINDMPEVGEKLDKLNPVTFRYNNDPSLVRHGLIYEDTLPVMPEICREGKEYGSIEYVELIPMLLKEIQSLRKRISLLENNKIS